MSFLKKNDIDFNAIPDSLNLETGIYKEAIVSSAKLVTNKKTNISSLIIEFKDQDPDSPSCGKTWPMFLTIPDPSSMDKATLDQKLYYYKKTLKDLGLSDYQIENLDDPEMDEDSKIWLNEIEGILHLKTKNSFTNMVKFERTSPNSMVTEGGGEIRKIDRTESIPTETTPAPVAASSGSSDWD